MSIRVAINGFGRVGRYFVRTCINNNDLKIVAINSRAKIDILYHLLKWDSIHGKLNANLSYDKNLIFINNKKIKIINFLENNISQLPWKSMNIDIVIEATGKFKQKEQLVGHLKAGAKKVIIAYPAKGADITICMGVNEEKYLNSEHNIISNASCTTNCLAPIAKIINNNYGIKKGLMTTIHSYTMDQRILDGSHHDFRRARAAALSIIPTSTGAAKAIAKVIPELKNKLDGIALRVPTPNVSLIDFVVETYEKNMTIEKINNSINIASKAYSLCIIDYCEDELVSIDFTGNPYSAIFDASLTRVLNGNLIKLFSWYDNESGYCHRLKDLTVHIGKKFE